MVQRTLLTILTLFCFCTWAQDEDERVYVASCSLFVKVSVYTPELSDASGKAMIEATLCDKGGIPIPNQTIKITATCGTLSCLSMDTSPADSGRSCFVTGSDGKVQAFLVDIPFNKPGRVKASCTYGDFKVQASTGYSITRKIIKKGTGTKR